MSYFAVSSESQAIDQQIDQLEFVVFLAFQKVNMFVNPWKLLLLNIHKKILKHVLLQFGISKSLELVLKFKSILQQPVHKPEGLEYNLAC